MRRLVVMLLATVMVWGSFAAGGISVAAQGASPDDRGTLYLGRFRGILVRMGAPVEDGRCPVMTVEITGPGSATHLGGFTTEQSHCVDPTGPDPLAFTDGEYTFTADDDSAISGRYHGWLVPTDSTAIDGLYLIEGRWTIEEGTGRFEGATGAGIADGLQNLETGQASLVLEGLIAYPGLAGEGVATPAATPVS